MTLRIEISSDGESTLLQLSGDLLVNELEELAKHIKAGGPRVKLDLEGLRTVGLEAVQFLVQCEDTGVAVLKCPPYVRAWMNRERERARGQV